MTRLHFLNKPQRGFTLIELIITIVIIGILAAVAIPRFVDLSSDANTGVARGSAAAVASATSVNYARRAGGSTAGSALADCDAVNTNLAALASVPTGTVITGGTLQTNGTTGTCTLTYTNGSSAAVTTTFQAYGSL